jgi:hypothetical protein
MKKKTIDTLYVMLIISLILFMAFCVYFLSSKGRECLQQPFQYGITELGGEITCECSRVSGMNKAYFGFNTTDQWDSKDPYDVDIDWWE